MSGWSGQLSPSETAWRADALAFGNARDRSAVHVPRSADYRVFHELSLQFASADAPDLVFQQVAERARDTLGGEIGCLCLAGASGEVTLAGCAGPRGAPVRSTGHLLQVRALSCPYSALSPEDANHNVSMPLRLGDVVVGRLCVTFRTPRALIVQEREILQQLAEAAAVAAVNTVNLANERQVAALEERRRLSRELHDSLAQVLAYLRVRAVAVRGTVARGDGATAIAELDEMAQVALDAYRDVREAILGLRETVPSKDGLTVALREYGEKFSRQSGVAVTVELDGCEPPPLAGDVEVQLVRVVQEALTNVRKHAGAARVTIRVKHTRGATVIEVEDDGCGFDREAVGGREQHFGLCAMHERLERVGGLLEISSTPGRGTTVRITIGVRNEQRIGASSFLAERATAARAS